MVSTFSLVGIMIIFGVSVLVPLTWLWFCIQKSRKVNLLMVALIGFAAISVTSNLSAIVGSIKPVYNLAMSGEPGNFLLYLLICTVVAALVEALVRLLVVNYAYRVGGAELGYYRAMTVGVGLGAGYVLTGAFDYIELFVQAQLINAGEFLNIFTEGEGAVSVAEAEEYMERLTSYPGLVYYAQALDRGVLVILEVALTMILAGHIVNGSKTKGFFLTAAMRFGFEFFRLALGYLADDYLGKLVSPVAEAVLLIIFMVLVGLFFAMVIYTFRAKKLLKEDVGSGVSKKEEVKKQQKRKAWGEMQSIGKKNLSNMEFKDPYQKEEDQ